MEYYNVVNDRYLRVASDSTVHIVYKCELLSHSEDVIGVISGSMINVDGSSISVNNNQGTRRSGSLSLIDSDGELYSRFTNEPNWFIQKIKLYAGVEDRTNADRYWFSEGVFYISEISENRGSSTVSMSMVDKFGLFDGGLNRNQLTEEYVIPAGSTVSDAIIGILHIDMGNGLVCDPIDPVLPDWAYTTLMPLRISKAAGSYIGDLLIEIANTFGCNLFYDVDGRLHLEDKNEEYPYAYLGEQWNYSDIAPEYSDAVSKPDLLKAINIVKVVSTNTKLDAVYNYEARNDNPASPISVAAIGKKALYVGSATVASTKNCKEYAELLLRQQSLIAVTMSFSSPLLPHLDVDNIITVSDKLLGYQRERFVIQELSIPLSTTNRMSISVARVSVLPTSEVYAEGAVDSRTFASLRDNSTDIVYDSTNDAVQVVSLADYTSEYSAEQMDDFICEVLHCHNE